MTSVKDRLNKVVPHAESGEQGSDPPDQQSSRNDGEPAPKYMLRVTAGPSYDPSTHQLVHVNGQDALEFSNQFMRVKVKVRIRDYQGLPKHSPGHSPYFDDPVHDKDRYSIGFSFVPNVDLPSKDVVWGNDFDHPVRDRLPPGFNTAFKIVKEFIDPGLSCDAYADQPWLYGPALSCWFAFRAGDQVADHQPFPQPEEHHVMTEGADGSGHDVRMVHDLPDDAGKRRRFFLKPENRENFRFEVGRVYQGDFFNPYLDFNNFALRLPGFSLSVIRYINDKTHNLRYVFKNVKTGDVYFVVVFTLLFGEQLEAALAQEQEGQVQEQMNAD